MTKPNDGVTSHTALEEVVEGQLLKPDDPEDPKTVANPKKYDPMLVGYVYQYAHDLTKTPYDFLNNPRDPDTHNGDVTRGIYLARVWGVRCIDLREGIEDATLPPLAIWELGTWWDKMPEEPFAPLNDTEDAVLSRCCWITDGQGTPGNYMYNCYLVPEKIAGQLDPKHPLIWGVKLTKGISTVHHIQRMIGGSTVNRTDLTHPKKVTPLPAKTWAAPVSKPAVVSAPKSTLPASVRFRCADCGHWFDENKLVAHAKSGFCPGKEAEGYSDWAVMCDKDCGCMTLDEAAACKEGFPRQKKEVTMSTTEAPEPTTPEPTEPAPAPEPAPEPETTT